MLQATSVSGVAGYGCFNEGLLLTSTQSGDGRHFAMVHFGLLEVPQT